MMNPKDARSEGEIFADIAELVSQDGYVHILAYLSWRDNFIPYGEELTAEDLERSYSTERLIRTEMNTLIGLMLNEPMSTNLPNPKKFQELTDQTIALMGELHAAMNKPMMEIFTPENLAKVERPFHQADILREPIFYGGESAFNFQFSDFAAIRYAKDDGWLTKNLGFTSSQMVVFANSLTAFLNKKIFKQIEEFRNQDPREWTLLNAFRFTVQDIAEESGLRDTVVQSIISAFSVRPGHADNKFEALGDFNIANAKPLIDFGDSTYLCLQSYSLCEGLYDSPFYWMQGDKEYRPIARRHRGAFTEEFVAQRLATVFGPENVFTNVNLERGKSSRAGEIDVFVKFGNRALVVQCKSKKLTLEARKGNDGQLKDDFKKAIQDSYNQALSCSEHLIKGDVSLVLEDGTPIDTCSFDEIYPICVTSENYPALTVQVREILEYKKNDEKISPPFVADVFFIDVLCEFLTSPLYLLSYINRRVHYQEKLNVVSELTILSFHLKSNLWIEDDMHFLMLDESCAIDLDTAFTVRRQGIPGATTPNGILTRLRETYVGRLIRSIEQSSEPPLIDLGFSLLRLSEETYDSIEQGVRQICDQFVKDGKLHDFTLAFGDGEEGITVHCGSYLGSPSVGKLRRHCERRKYVSKARRWYGLFVRAQDGMPKFGINLKGEWKKDSDLEEETKGMNRLGNLQRVGRQLKRVKIGRNEPCPCGSGKKYKKCCLN